MSDLLNQLKEFGALYKGIGAKFTKSLLVEYFLDANHDDVVAQVAGALSHYTPADMQSYIRDGTVPHLPPSFFRRLQNFEDWLANFEPERFFELIAEASPEIANAIMEMGEEGAVYMLKFKQYVLDSVRALNAEEEQPEEIESSPAEIPAPRQQHFGAKFAGGDEEKDSEVVTPPGDNGQEKEIPPIPGPAKRRKRLTCDSCHESWLVHEAEVPLVTECPFCHAPA